MSVEGRKAPQLQTSIQTYPAGCCSTREASGAPGIAPSRDPHARALRGRPVLCAQSHCGCPGTPVPGWGSHPVGCRQACASLPNWLSSPRQLLKISFVLQPGALGAGAGARGHVGLPRAVLGAAGALILCSPPVLFERFLASGNHGDGASFSFLLPGKFLGDQRLSYGQPLTLTFRVPPRVALPPVQLRLEGAGLALSLRHANVSGPREAGEVQLRFP